MSTPRGGAKVLLFEGDSRLSGPRSLIEGLCRSWTNTPPRTRARREPSLESTSAATLLLRGTCWNLFDNPPRKIPYYRLRPVHFGH
jgi:hypothetical protein